MESSFLAVFLQSLLVGVAIVAPIGPMAQVIIQRTLTRGRWGGLSCGLAVAAGVAVYGALGAFGAAALLRASEATRLPLAFAAGAFLLWLAWRTWRRVPPLATALPGGSACSLRLAFAHPLAVPSFMAIFGAWAGRGLPASPWALILGVLAGSIAWWLLLSLLVAHLRGRFDHRVQRWVNRVAALLVASFAMWQWASLLAARPDLAGHPLGNLVADWWPSA